MDSGANEVVRPYSSWEWEQIESKKPHTRKMTVGLALGSAMQAGITMGGELMRAPPKYTHLRSGEGDCNWSCPLGRCRHELGIDYHWTSKGPRLSGGMLKEPLYGVVIGGLPFFDVGPVPNSPVCTATKSPRRAKASDEILWRRWSSNPYIPWRVACVVSPTEFECCKGRHTGAHDSVMGA